MTRVIAGRLLQAVAVVWIVATACFFMAYALPGDAAYRIAAARSGQEHVGIEQVARVRAEAGLDRPLVVQYVDWLARAATGDFGRSLVSGEPVTAELAYHGGYSLTLGLLAWLLAYAIALPFGIAAALRPGGAVDRAAGAFAALFASIPTFVLALMLVLLFAVTLRWLPAAGFRTPAHLVLPALALALSLAAFSVQVVRNAVADVERRPYVTFARLLGASRLAALVRHVPRNAAVPVVTFAALQMAAIVDGFLMAEIVFNYPGLGRMMVEALSASDVPLIMGAAILVTLSYTLVNLAADLLLTTLDPRLARQAAA